jgi:simple sugar transport system permease protein
MYRVVRRPEFASFVVLVAIYVFFAVAGSGAGFATVTGTASWVNFAAELAIVAIPVGLLMIAGEFDLSIGSTIAASAMAISLLVSQAHWSMWAAIIVVMIAAGLIGLVNGVVTVTSGVPSFIVTLGMQFLIIGVALGMSNVLVGTTQVSMMPYGSAKHVFGGSIGQFHASVVWFAVIAFISYWVLARTRFGNWTYATGGDSLSWSACARDCWERSRVWSTPAAELTKELHSCLTRSSPRSLEASC